MAATLLLERCNPYGAETGGPRRVMGGLHGPGSAATPDLDLPENVAQGEWRCEQQAQVRVRMECRCGHRGQIMALCSWHDEIVYGAEMVGGTTRRVSSVIRQRGHYEEIQRRQSSSCIRCLYPGRYAEDYKSLEAWQTELYFIVASGGWYTRRASEVKAKIERIREEFDIGNQTGEIHRCPLLLVPVS